MAVLTSNIRTTAETLARMPPAHSMDHMVEGERAGCIEQMLKDLYMLATNDGCIAAAWALEFAFHIAQVQYAEGQQQKEPA